MQLLYPLFRIGASLLSANLLSKMTIPVYPGEDYGFVGAVVVTGVAVVSLILIILILVMTAFGGISSLAAKKAAKASSAEKREERVVPLVSAEAYSKPDADKDSGATAAVIAAAVAAIGEEDGRNYRVAGFRKNSGVAGKPLISPWRSAGLSENARPFTRN